MNTTGAKRIKLSLKVQHKLDAAESTSHVDRMDEEEETRIIAIDVCDKVSTISSALPKVGDISLADDAVNVDRYLLQILLNYGIIQTSVSNTYYTMTRA